MTLSKKETEYFEKMLKQMSKQEIVNSKVSPVDSIYDLIDVLLLRIPKPNINNIADVRNSLIVQLDRCEKYSKEDEERLMKKHKTDLKSEVKKNGWFSSLFSK